MDQRIEPGTGGIAGVRVFADPAGTVALLSLALAAALFGAVPAAYRRRRPSLSFWLTTCGWRRSRG